MDGPPKSGGTKLLADTNPIDSVISNLQRPELRENTFLGFTPSQVGSTLL